MNIYIGSVVELWGYNNTMKHVKECLDSPWIKGWKDEYDDNLLQLLKKDYDRSN